MGKPVRMKDLLEQKKTSISIKKDSKKLFLGIIPYR